MAKAHNWFIDEAGSAKGPFKLGDIRRMLDQGTISEHTMVCPEGTVDWRPATSLFQSAAKNSSSRSLLGATQVVFSGLGLVAFGVFLYGIQKAYEQTLFRLDSLEEELGAIRSPGRFVPLEQVTHQCFGVQGSTSCTFTNLEKEAIFTCAEGRLQNKEVPALHLVSQALCSGKLSPGATTTVSAPWIGGFADDICNKETSFGKSLDWKKCDFDTVNLDASALSPTGRKP